ncbi:MAG: CDP-alcohol phosphatidyltransferase family protein [Candidatus Omnitrophota bacterium]|jgi:CDP-diacylglycerol--glycerol-3-phosphate 3-phosphatidyltransferase
MLRKTIYPKFESLITRTAAILDRKGLSPNQLTILGCVLSLLAGGIYSAGNIFLGGIAILAASMTDLLDGPLARLSGRTSKFGAFLDSTLDRYSDFFIFGGLAVCYARNAEYGLMILVLGSLAGAFVTSYAKARVENFIPDGGVGIFGRAERIILLAIGSLVWPILPYVLWILLIGNNATAIHRILFARKNLSPE